MSHKSKGYDRAKRREIQQGVQAELARREGRNTSRGLLAAELVRGWPIDMRARVRSDLLLLIVANDPDMPVLETPEMQLVKLIDQINEEEQ